MKPSKLKAILEDHRLWVESGYKQGKRANLRGAYLRGANLRGTDLGGANLRGATFDLNFKKVAYFQNATFSEDQIAWVCLHPRFSEWASTLKWVKSDKLSA